jgi:hypothetical protein
MKKIISLTLILFSISFAFAQETPPKPLTQAEYVKLLYDVQRNPGKKDELVEAIRRRGIVFQLTDGLRSLTRSKGKNDSELQRTLEEAERRRQNPNAAKLPSEKEAAEIIQKTRANTLAAVEEMPDFTVKQLINRGTAYAGTNNWKSIDNLTVAVNYSTTKGEQYQVLAINGTRVNAEAGSNYSGLDGTTSSGEFVEDLKKIFKAESKTEFKLADTDVLRNRQAIIYEYKITLENNKGGITLKDSNYTSVAAGQQGKIWIDRNLFRVLRIEYHLTDIPSSFPVKTVRRLTDYNFVEIAGEKYLLPILSDFRGTVKGIDILFENRNLIRFKDYQKYGSEVKILDDDQEVPEEKPQN